MDSMNNMCKNVSALGLRRREDSPAIDDGGLLTTSTPIETADSFIRISTETGSPPHAKRSASFSTVSEDRFFSLNTSDHADTDFYVTDSGANDAEKSFNVTFADQLTSMPTTSSKGKDLRQHIILQSFVLLIFVNLKIFQRHSGSVSKHAVISLL